MINSYRTAKRKERDYNLYWRARGFFVRPQSIPFFVRWIAGVTRELETQHQKELDGNREEFRHKL